MFLAPYERLGSFAIKIIIRKLTRSANDKAKSPECLLGFVLRAQLIQRKKPINNTLSSASSVTPTSSFWRTNCQSCTFDKGIADAIWNRSKRAISKRQLGFGRLEQNFQKILNWVRKFYISVCWRTCNERLHRFFRLCNGIAQSAFH